MLDAAVENFAQVTTMELPHGLAEISSTYQLTCEVSPSKGGR